MNVLVTGGAGYLGSTLVEVLLKEGHTVVVVDNFMYNQASLNHLCFSNRLKIHRTDVRNEKDMASLLNKADLIIPLAALVGAPLCDRDPVGAETVNKTAIFNML